MKRRSRTGGKAAKARGREASKTKRRDASKTTSLSAPIQDAEVARLTRELNEAREQQSRRKQFAALFDDAAKRKFDCVLFWALDRFSREGMAQTIAHLQRLVSYGVAFHSYTEPHLATDNELVRNILLALLSSLAKLEAQKISERTKAGMARAKANGIKIGRPSLGLKLAKRSCSERRRARHLMPSPRRLVLIGILRPSTHDSVLNAPSREAAPAIASRML